MLKKEAEVVGQENLRLVEGLRLKYYRILYIGTVVFLLFFSLYFLFHTWNLLV